jgi:hypothetical protein
VLPASISDHQSDHSTECASDHAGRWRHGYIADTSCVMANASSKKQPTWLEYVACYALYLLLIVGGGATLFFLLRRAILALITTLLGPSEANRLIYLASITLLGLGLFILVMAAEPYLRNGLVRRQLLRRFIRIAMPVVVAAVLGLLVLAIVG